MPSSDVQRYSDPDDYAAGVRATKAEITVLGRGHFTAKRTRIDLHQLWMQRFSESLPRVAHSATAPGRAIVSFRTHPGPSLLWRGTEPRPGDLLLHKEGADGFQQSSGPVSFAAISLLVEDMASVGAAIAGCDLTPPKDSVIITPAPDAMATLRRLHAAAGLLAEEAPEIIAHPETARSLEQALIKALVDCLGEGFVDEDTSAQRRHSLIMRRFHRVVEENPGRPLYIPELCAATGVSDRTLRICCQEQLGMSPHRYLWLRRMNLARRAFALADPTATTVTVIATNYGFGELGRFAVQYRDLFGESPSATLRRALDDRQSCEMDQADRTISDFA